MRAERRSVTLPALRLHLSMSVAAQVSAAVPAFIPLTLVLAYPSSVTGYALAPLAIVDAERRSAAVLALGRLLTVLANPTTIATAKVRLNRPFKIVGQVRKTQRKVIVKKSNC